MVECEGDVHNVILLSGGRTTVPLADGLARHYSLAVYDPEAVPQFVGTGRREIFCPLSGVGPGLRDMALSDTANLTGRIAGMVPLLGPRFSLDGMGTPGEIRNWLPALSLILLSSLTLELRAMAAFCSAVGVNIKAVVTHEDVTPRFRAMTLYAKSRGFPTIHIPHASHFGQVQPDVHDRCFCDYILAASPWMRDWYTERGFPPDHIRVVGAPNWDPWANHRRSIPQHAARNVLHLKGDGPVVLYCTSWPQDTNLVDDHSIWDRAHLAMLKATRRNHWQLIWSLHPSDPVEYQQRYARLALEQAVPAVIVRGHLPYTVMASDVVVAVGPSNVLIEAVLAGRPVVTIPLEGYSFPEEPPWRASPTSRSLGKVIKRVLDGAKWDRGAFVQRFAYSDDGKSTERAVAAIREVIDA